jgi:uncharacterized membrane protein affecting hemolysin expression
MPITSPKNIHGKVAALDEKVKFINELMVGIVVVMFLAFIAMLLGYIQFWTESNQYKSGIFTENLSKTIELNQKIDSILFQDKTEISNLSASLKELRDRNSYLR